MLATLLLPLWPLGCESESTDSTGGETHFLRICDDDPDACGTALSCLCGVCTVACQVAESCAGFPGAECAAGPSSCTASTNTCDLSCSEDDDCAPLSADHRCVQGSCRLDAPSPPGGQGGSDGGTGGSPGSECTSGTVAPNGVVVLGDSFFATNHQITAYLEDLARAAGALDAGERYRDVSRLTANALALSSSGILNQYLTAAADAEVEVVIMNGGGADVLLGACDGDLPTCPVLTAAAAAFDEVLQTMADDGVDGVVFAGYPDPQLDGVRQKMDALRPLLQASCEQSPVPCHFLDLRPTFEGNYETFILADGINPTAAGSQATAEALWAALAAECWAQ